MKLLCAAAVAVSVCATAAGATTVDWNFQGTYHGSGQITYDDATDVIQSLTGSYNGQELAFVSLSADPNNPSAMIGDNKDGTSTYRAVPNTGSANYQYDDLFHQTPTTNGILVSTGTGADEIVYIMGYDGPDYVYFNIVTSPSYQYVEDRGVFTSTPAAAGAVPEPASWAMMIGGFGMIGAGMRRRRATVSFA